MKIEICISKVESVSQSGWPSLSTKLEVSGDGVTFRVDDTRQARQTYVVGRLVTITIKPGAQS